MMHSAELRWFFLGATPKAAKTWFGARDERREESRTDRYLMLPGSRTVGVKLRGRRFEIKSLISGPTRLRLASGAVGRTDTWVKWSIEFPAADEVASTITRDARWVAIQKLRWLRKYRIGAGPRIEEVDRDEQVDEGCNVELTELGHLGPDPDDRWRWWTIGFEAFGPPARVEGNLQTGLDAFFSKMDRPLPAPMLEANSMSYPAWFESVGLV
jgi:hypothetical protein